MSSKKHIQTLETTILPVGAAPEPILEIAPPPELPDPTNIVRVSFIYNSCYETKCRSRIV